MKYTNKPLTIDAIQWTGYNTHALIAFVGDNLKVYPDVLGVDTLDGVMTVRIYDYVIKGMQGEFYPCKPDIFEATYTKGENK